MKRALTLVVAIFFLISVHAQFNGGGTMPSITITGKVIDKENKNLIPFVTVYLKHLKDSTFFSGGLANDSGEFVIDQLKPGKYEIKISSIGYVPYFDTLSLPPSDTKYNLGFISIALEIKNMEEYKVVENKFDFQLGIDRKIFNVDRNSIVAGGSVLDVMKQVPTINVDVDGGITLKGNGSFIIFINGKTSGLTADNRSQILNQIPASNI